MKHILEVPHLVQYYNIDDEKWQSCSCGIVSLAMIFDYYSIPFDLDDMINRALKDDGYIKGVGWKHQTIVDLAIKYGLKAYRTENDTIEKLMESLEKDEPVIISIYKDFDLSNGGHLAVLNGYYIANQELIGFYVNDPVGASYKHQNQFIKLDKFLEGWKKRAIYVTKA
ncbi:MAG: C39 family peptidase [Patescibacteria group bacterium]|jgi:ABC-type bacteriocin/lantibiotic exporter with double-glycine peptidase domain|nr:C39 family peptidase [Patescibacteria group bacterium]